MILYKHMCYGIPLFSNGKKVLMGVGTNSHSTTAERMKFKEDDYRKYEFHWWKGEIVDEHYDTYAEKLLEKINKKKADRLVKSFIKKNLRTPFKIYKWLKDVPNDWDHLHEVGDKKLKTYLFKKIIGHTPEENTKELKKAEKRVKVFVDRVKNVKWFKPSSTINKKEISLKLRVSLNLFHLPKADLEFKYLNTSSDWDAARDAARDAAWGAARDAAWGAARDAAWGAARGAAWGAARDAAWGAAWDAAWGAAWGAAWDAARDAEALLVQDIKAYKAKYSKNPFMPLFELWEMGLYPCGLVSGKFLIYVPLVNGKEPEII